MTTAGSKFLFILLTVCGWLLAWPVLLPAETVTGPLHTANRFPLHLMFLTPTAPPAQLDAGQFQTSLSIDYSSVYVNLANSDWQVLMDLETVSTDLSLDYGVTPRFTVGLKLPVVGMMDGFLDGFLENYHNALNLPNYGREERPKNTFGYVARKDSRPWFDGQRGYFGLADMTVYGLLALVDEKPAHAFSAGMQTVVKLPTGNPSRGTGSGRMDVGLYLPARWTLKTWDFFLMPGGAWIADPKTDGAAIEARPVFSALGSIAYHHGPRWQWLAQLNYYSSPLERTGFSVIDDGSLEMTLGLRYRFKPSLYGEFGFSEDLTRAAPDFTLHFGLAARFSSTQRH